MRLATTTTRENGREAVNQVRNEGDEHNYCISIDIMVIMAN